MTGGNVSELLLQQIVGEKITESTGKFTKDIIYQI
jgi:hypothetical protein